VYEEIANRGISLSTKEATVKNGGFNRLVTESTLALGGIQRINATYES
jgi:hypothetical protein